MNDFLIKFFPVVYQRKLSAQESDYCKYDNQGLQTFTSSLYIAGLLATLVASYTTRKWGRKATMFIGGTAYLVGSILNAAAQDLAMLIIGRIMLGIGVGFGNQVRLLFQLQTSSPLPELIRHKIRVVASAVIHGPEIWPCLDSLSYYTSSLAGAICVLTHKAHPLSSLPYSNLALVPRIQPSCKYSQRHCEISTTNCLAKVICYPLS